MTKEQEKSIEILKETQDSYLKDELDLAIEEVLNLIQQLQEENKQKDEMINEMAKYIRVDDIEEDDDIDLCDFLGKSYSDCRNLSSACKECIKQYFKNKAQEIK